MAKPASVRRRAPKGILAWSLLMLVVSASCQRSPVPNSQQWVGKRVITKSVAGLQLSSQAVNNEKLGNSAADSRTLGRVYRVERVSGPWLALKDENSSAAGWVTADGVVLYDQAIDYFTSEILRQQE